jgi:hypothetical protein
MPLSGSMDALLERPDAIATGSFVVKEGNSLIDHAGAANARTVEIRLPLP